MQLHTEAYRQLFDLSVTCNTLGCLKLNSAGERLIRLNEEQCEYFMYVMGN
jgi:hypothetical protein